jgi:hypothetical protein
MPRAVESLLVLLFIASLALLVPEIPAIDNTLGGAELVLRAALLGLLLSAVPVYLLIHADWWLEMARAERAATVFTAGLSLALLSITAASLVNRSSSAALQHKPAQIADRGCSNGSCHVFVRIEDGRLERLELTRPLPAGAAPGQEAALLVKPGILGYPYVTAMTLAGQRLDIGSTYSSRLVQTAALLTSALVVSASVSLLWLGALGWLRRRHPSPKRRATITLLDTDALGADMAPRVPPEAAGRLVKR